MSSSPPSAFLRPAMSLVAWAGALALAACSTPAGAIEAVTPLLRAGRADEARNNTAIWYHGDFYGYAGHYSVPAEHKAATRTNHIYAWYQPCRDCAGPGQDAPGAPPRRTVIWLQGGPGGPGWFGAFGELGNFYIGGNTTDAEPHDRCFSWCTTNDCVFVDQPVNTGFSYQTDSASGAPITNVDDVDYTDTSRGAMAQVLSVLLQMYEVYPELAQSPLVITGESYGGLYAPNLGLLVAEHNGKVKSSGRGAHIDFAGLAVGDPCINWERQMPTYPDTLYGMGVVMLDEREDLRNRMETSVSYLKQSKCQAAFDAWNLVWDDNGGLGPSLGRGWFARTTGSFNTENVLMGNSPTGWEYIGKFWAKKDAQVSFHVDGVPAASNASANGLNIYNAFVKSGDWCANSSWVYARLLLDAKVDMMIYSGTADPLLGPPTTEAGVFAILDDAKSQNPAGGKQIASKFTAAKKDVWFVDAAHDVNPAGYARCAEFKLGADADSQRFCYTVVRNAGHEMPGYQPRAAFDMLNRFVEGREWNSTGDRPVPTCDECSGVGPFAGAALPGCHGSGHTERDEL